MPLPAGGGIGLAANNVHDWTIQVEGMWPNQQQFSLAQLMAAPRRTQITRHDCVEGWSAIGEWAGVPLGLLLRRAGMSSNAKFVVFHCADSAGGMPYYESIDMIDAFHPQTILATHMNGAPLTVGHGAPLRLRVERQLGYKQAKYVMRVEAVASLDDIYGGTGGYWEDRRGYQCFAGSGPQSAQATISPGRGWGFRFSRPLARSGSSRSRQSCPRAREFASRAV